MASPVTSVRAWVDERFHLDEFKALAQKKKVPIHRYSYWYFLGGMTLFLFGVQILTGALLLLYYRPGADEAFESVQFIMTQVQFGFYKKGCQEKTLLPAREQRYFSDIQPLPVALAGGDPQFGGRFHLRATTSFAG